MSNGFSQRGADGITRHYNSNGVMTGFSQKGSDGFIRHYDNNRNVRGFSQSNGYGGYNHYDGKGHKKNSSLLAPGDFDRHGTIQNDQYQLT